MERNSPLPVVLAHVEIKEALNGMAQIYIDGHLVNGVIGYRVEQDAAEKRVPVLTMQVQCQLTLDCGAIPVLPEPWSWFYEPKVSGFVDPRELGTV